MAHDHKACDDEYALIEQALGKGDWPRVLSAIENFCAAMERHLGVEEAVLFPAFEQATGMTMGPTRVMRMEHAQLRGLFDEIRAAAVARDEPSLRGQAETLLIMMQQHNLKEENVLYPMCDQHLAGGSAGLAAQLADAVRRSSRSNLSA
jgi:iron-sulfur cluster repair protein YtfE (RIC family)